MARVDSDSRTAIPRDYLAQDRSNAKVKANRENTPAEQHALLVVVDFDFDQVRPPDLRALTRKLDAMWALGFRAFQLQFQDVSYSEWHCGADADRFGSGPGAAARARQELARVVQCPGKSPRFGMYEVDPAGNVRSHAARRGAPGRCRRCTRRAACRARRRRRPRTS